MLMAKHFALSFRGFWATFEHHAPQISVYARMHNCFEITKAHTHIHAHTYSFTHTRRRRRRRLVLRFVSLSFSSKSETRTFCRVLKITFWPILFLGFCFRWVR